MKRMLTIMVMVFAAAASGLAQAPTTTWPYIYGDFTDGSVVMLANKAQKTGQYNVCLDGARLHYIDGEYVRVVSPGDIVSAQIGNDFYQNVGGRMLKVLAKSEKCLIVEDKEIDYASLNSTGGAYGSSSKTLGTMNLSSAEGIGGSNSSKSLNHMELKHEKDLGKELPLIVKNYIFVKGHKIFCTKKDVMEAAKDKAAAKQFFKENDIKWKNSASVVAVGDFLYEQL